MNGTGGKESLAKGKRLRIAIADDHALTRGALFSIISQNGYPCELVGEASTAVEAVTLCQRLTPDLLLFDVNMPGQNPLAVVPKIKRIAPRTRILLYCTEAKRADILGAMRAGADGFLEKTCSRNDFLEAVNRLSKGDNYLCARSINVLATSLRGSAVLQSRDGQPNSELTIREKQILTLVASGDSSKEIAKKLFLSVSTVETHRANLMTKIRARNVAQLIQYGFQHGLVDFGRTPAA